MLHGAIGSHLDWTRAQEFFNKKGFLTELHDLYSYIQKENYSFNQFSNSLNHSLSEGENNKQNLIGYSLGGRLALHALLDSPSLWNKAVIVSAHTGLAEKNSGEREARIASDRMWADLAYSKDLEWTDFLVKWNQQSVLKPSINELLGWSDRLSLESVREDVGTSLTSWSLGLQEDLLERLSCLTMPILWVVGENDPKFVEIAKKATDVLANAKLQIIGNSGHRVPWEQSGEFHSLVSEWFTD